MRVADLKRMAMSIPGWRTRRKILVFESDDWGSIRMPSKDAYSELVEAGVDIVSGDSYRYNKYDTLARQDDLIALFETLQSVKDNHGNCPVFTAVSVVANPDFEKIQRGGFADYYYEPFTDTLNKYPGRQGVYELILSGIQQKIFVPQFHGREHLNIHVWMKLLQEGDREVHLAFKLGLWGINNRHPLNISYQAAFDLNSLKELESQHRVIKEGCDLFQQLFGYRASFFVPPNSKINNELEKVATASGIKYMANAKLQREVMGQGKSRKRIHYLGQKSKHGQTYILRNCFFEPSKEGVDWVDSCLHDIDIAFKCNKPAIIGTHRVNYIGSLVEKNRQTGLKQLNLLLLSIVRKWPDIEFLTTEQLGEMINGMKYSLHSS
jgi:hypothetical protein